MARPLPFLLAVVLLAGCGDFIPPQLTDGSYKLRDAVRMLAAGRVDQAAGGNVELGTASPTGATGKVSLSLRVIGVSRETPRLGGVPITTSGQPPSGTIPTESGTAFSVGLDGTVSLWSGFGMGPGHLLGVDLLASVAALSGYEASDLGPSGGSIAVAGGVRLGIMEETPRTPGISLSVLHRGLPSLTLAPDPLATDDGTITVDPATLDVSATSARLAISKQWGKWGATIGYGSDLVQVNGDVELALSGSTTTQPTTARVSQDVEVRRNLVYGGVAYRFGGITVAGEVGRRSGKPDAFEAHNTLAGGWNRNFLSVGVRVGSR